MICLHSSLIAVYRHRRGFSLVEVVVAMGIFAIAVIAIVGLLIPITQSISEVKDGDDASRVAQTIQAELQKYPFADVQAFISTNVVDLYATRSGNILARETPSPGLWDVDSSGTLTPDEQALKFFKVELRPNDILSPNGTTSAYDEGYLAFTIVLRWPGYTADGNPFPQREQQSVLVFPAAITR